MPQFRLSDIKFPIYTLTPNYKKIWEEYNVLYIETPSGIYVLDNKNLPGDTLGRRRLKINTSDKYIPRRCYLTLSQMINGKDKWFIDSEGKHFKWTKSEYVKLKYHKVKKVHRSESYCILHLHDIIFPQKVNCRLAYAINYVGVLHSNDGYILYEYTDEKKKDTMRKI